MRIAINLTAVREDMAGPMNYCAGFLAALGGLAPQDQFLIFLTPDVRRHIKLDHAGNFAWHLVDFRKRIWLRVIWEQLVLPLHLLKWRAEALFAAFDLAPFFSPCATVLGIRNPSPVRKTAGIDWKALTHRWLSRYSCKRAQYVFYPTKYAEKLLGEALRVPAEKRRVIPHGTDHELWRAREDERSILKNYGVESGCYLLFVSNFYPYKQPDLVVKAFALWLAQSKRAEFKLLLVGKGPKIFDEFEIKLRGLVGSLVLQGSVIFTGYVPRAHLPALYRHSAAFVLPTLIETFGHPFVEAMACGAPVVCMDTEFARELCGEAARYLPNSDPIVLAEAIETIIAQPALADAMRRAGISRSKEFSWEREARETLGLLRAAADPAR